MFSISLLSIVESKAIKASISFSGLDQFSFEKVYSVKYGIPLLMHSLIIFFAVCAPFSWPKTLGLLI